MYPPPKKNKKPKIIITDDGRYCPVNVPNGFIIEIVSPSNIKTIDNNNKVEIIICSRAMAKACQTINLPNWKYLQLFSVGYDNLNLDWFKERNIVVCNASGIYDDTLAEYVLLNMLLYTKRYHSSIKNWLFRPFRNYHYMTELRGKSVGILGCGRIATAIANRLTGFKVKIYGYARTTSQKEHFQEIFHEKNLSMLFQKCDFIINTLPHDSSTIGLINSNILSYARENLVFINIGRDSIFHKDDFYDFMNSHKKATAILDMFEIIPNPITNKYHRLNNVLITPRIAANSKESETHLIELIEYNLSAITTDGRLKNRLI